jgi:hypothetical protein
MQEARETSDVVLIKLVLRVVGLDPLFLALYCVAELGTML